MNFHNAFRGTFKLYVALERVWGNSVLGKWTALTEALTHTLVHHWAAAARQVAAKPIGSNSVSCPRTLTACGQSEPRLQPRTLRSLVRLLLLSSKLGEFW